MTKDYGQVPTGEPANPIEWVYNDIGDRGWEYRLKNKLQLVKCDKSDDKVYIETNFAGSHQYNNPVREGVRNFYVGGQIVKCVYIREKSNITVYIVVIENKDKYILSFNEPLDTIVEDKNNHMIRNYINIDIIDKSFENLTIDSLNNLIKNNKLEFKYGSQTDYIYMPPFGPKITGDIRFDVVKPGLTAECDRHIKSLTAQGPRQCYCVIA